MPKDFTSPSQQWNIQDQIDKSKPIIQERNKALDNYNTQTDAYKNIDSILTDYENQGVDTSAYRSKLDKKAKEMELGFGEKLGVVGRNIGNDYVGSFSKAFGGDLEKSYSQKVDEAKQKREQAINPISTIASEVALDPLTYAPLNFASKGTQAVRFGKDFAKGAGLSAGTYTAKEYNNEDFKPEDALIAGTFGGLINGTLGKYLSKGAKGDLLNPDVTNAYNITDRILSEGNVPYTKDAKLAEYIKNKLPADKILEDSSPVANEAFQQNTVKSDGNNSADSIAKKLNDQYFGGKNVIPETAPIRNDMPNVDNQLDSNKVNDFFNPVDANRIEVQGKANLRTPASQQDPFVYQPKQADTFGWEKDAQRNQAIPSNDTPQLTETKSLEGVKRENLNDINLPPISEPKSILPDALPTDKQELMDVIRYAKDNNAVDEFISKLPPSSRIDEVKQFFDNLKPTQPRQTNSGILYSNGEQTLGGSAVGGLHAVATEQDYNNDGVSDYKDGLIGALIGAVGINTARKILPKAFKDPNIDKNTAGMFVGKSPIDTIRVENQGKYKIPLSQEVQDLSKIKTNELSFKEFNNPNAKHQEQGIVDSKSLKRHIDKILQNPNVYAKGTQKDSSLVALKKNGTDDIVVANSNNGNVISGFKNTDKKYMDKIIEKSMGGRPSSTVLHQGVDSTTSSIDKYNAVPHSLDKSISNNIPKSQDIKLNASPTISGGMVGGVVGANNDLNGDGKTNLTDILIGVGLGAGGTKGALLAKDTNIAIKAKDLIKNIADTETADKIFGHKIYQKTDYMGLREAMINSKNKQTEQFALLHEQLKLLPENDRKAMYEYMSGNKTVKIDKDTKAFADNYIGEINKMSKELVDLGQLDQAQFDKFKDRYLHRKYEKDFTQQFNSLFSKGKTIQGVHARGNEWNGSKAEYGKLLSEGKIGDFFSGKIEATRMQNGQYKFRQDWTEEQRTRWGEIKDIAFSLPETLARTKEMVDHATMLKNIVDNTGYVSTDPIEGYVHLAGKRYGALNGKYVPADIASDIKEFNNALFGTEGSLLSAKGQEAFKVLSTFWKKSHTVYNPIAHLNNLLSNVTMQFGAGINPNKAVVNATKGALASQKVNQFRELTAKQIVGLSPEESATLRALSQDEDLKLWNEAQQAGLFGRSNLNDILNRYINPNNTSVNTGAFKNLAQKTDDKLSSWYQGEDNIMRFSMLKSLKDSGVSFDDAIKKVNDTVPDYTKPMSQWARFGRDSMVTPFISWTYYATPIILKQMKENPERIVAIYGALYGANKLFGIDPFNESDIPQQNFSMKRIPIYKNGDEVTTVKVDRWIPHNDILSPLDFIKNLTSGGAWSPIKDIPRNQDSYFGGKITNKEGALKAYHLGKYAVEQITPDVLDNAYNFAESKIMSPEKRSKNPVIQPRTSTQELLKFLGINSMTYNKANQARKVANEKGN